ncbi:MAG: hypothetical protein AAFY65_13670 [Pseudomonadota bacterium]
MTKKTVLHTSLAMLTAFLLLIASLPAQAQAANCGVRGAVVERLSGQFGETRRGIGLGTQNRIVEVFASDETGTWTITITMPDGRMCLVASGQAWEERMDDLSHLTDADI